MLYTFERPSSYGQYLRHLLPSVLSMVFLSFYTTIDGFFVSRYAGSDALAGINIVIPITCLIFGFAVMLSTGAGAVIGEELGEKKEHAASELFSASCCVLLVFSVLFTILGLIFLRPIALLLGSTQRLMPHVLPYAAVTFLCTLSMSFKLFFEYLSRTDDRPQVGLWMSMTGLILNIILDAVFVAVLGLGTLGAALGTGLSITVSALIGLVYFLRHGTLGFVRPRASFSLLLRCCGNGCSEMLTELSTGITTFLFNISIMRYYHEDGVAAVTIIMYIYYFFLAFYMGICVAASPAISYSVGSRSTQKIRETLRYSFVTIALTSVFITASLGLAGPAIIRLFTAPGKVFDITWEGLRLFAPLFLCIGLNVFISAYFTALGNGFLSAVISTLRSLIFVLILIALLPNFWGANGIWLTMPFSEALTFVISLILYRRRGRKYLFTLPESPYQ